MKLNGRSILVLCLLIFGGYAVFDYYHEKSTAEVSMEASRLMTLNFEQVNDIVIQKGTVKIHLLRDVDGWKMEEPFKDNADNEAADDLVRSTFTEKIIEVVKEGDDIDWKLFGLDVPMGTVTFKSTDGKQNVFEISTTKNFEDNAFARRDDENKVILVNSIWQARVSKKGMEFRDRRFLRHKIASIDDIHVTNTKGSLHLKRVDGKWSVPEKPELKIDQNQIRSLLTYFADAKASEILEGQHQEPVTKPLFTLNLTMDSKKWTAQVGQAPDHKIYARVTDPKLFLKMEPGALDKLIDITADGLKEQPPEKKEK